MHFTLQIFYDSMNLSFVLGEREDILIGGESGEIPYDPIYLTSRTISQPKTLLRLPESEKILLERQRALNERTKLAASITVMLKYKNGFIVF